MTFDRTMLTGGDHTFRVSLMESPQGNFWQLSTTLPEAFAHCHNCNAEFTGMGKRMYCPRYISIYCENCDRHQVGCARVKDTDGHIHNNISHIEKIPKQEAK
jgi:hypothetical protein